MLKNPLNAEKDIDALVVELREPGSDAKTVAKLYIKIAAKGMAKGAVFTVAAGAVVASAIAVSKELQKEDPEN